MAVEAAAAEQRGCLKDSESSIATEKVAKEYTDNDWQQQQQRHDQGLQQQVQRRKRLPK